MRALLFRGRQVNLAVFIDIEEISLSVDRGRVEHAGEPLGSAEKAGFLGGVFRVQPKQLDEIC